MASTADTGKHSDPVWKVGQMAVNGYSQLLCNQMVGSWCGAAALQLCKSTSGFQHLGLCTRPLSDIFYWCSVTPGTYQLKLAS